MTKRRCEYKVNSDATRKYTMMGQKYFKGGRGGANDRAFGRGKYISNIIK